MIRSNKAIAASARRLMDDVLASADGCWRSRSEAIDQVHAYLDHAIE